MVGIIGTGWKWALGLRALMLGRCSRSRYRTLSSPLLEGRKHALYQRDIDEYETYHDLADLPSKQPHSTSSQDTPLLPPPALNDSKHWTIRPRKGGSHTPPLSLTRSAQTLHPRPAPLGPALLRFSAFRSWLISSPQALSSAAQQSPPLPSLPASSRLSPHPSPPALLRYLLLLQN